MSLVRHSDIALFFSHGDFLFCKHKCISYASLEIFGMGSLEVKLGYKIGRCMKKSKTTGL